MELRLLSAHHSLLPTTTTAAALPQEDMGINNSNLHIACQRAFGDYGYKTMQRFGSSYFARLGSRDAAVRAAQDVTKLGRTRTKVSLYDPSILTTPMVFITKCDPFQSDTTASSDAIIAAVADAACTPFSLERDLVKGCIILTFARQLEDTTFRIRVTMPYGLCDIDFDLANYVPCKVCDEKHVRRAGDTAQRCSPMSFKVATAPAHGCKLYLTVPPRV